ncbi:hypothetical protein RRSWK_04670 [Rhodopirellula sp. SWK7]|nr:hypothetical protein RRSWK_04670 [Rhodopirellula sp. SWK7]
MGLSNLAQSTQVCLNQQLASDLSTRYQLVDAIRSLDCDQLEH